MICDAEDNTIQKLRCCRTLAFQAGAETAFHQLLSEQKMGTDIALNSLEQEMLDGSHGLARKWAMRQQLQVAQFFQAKDFVEVSQVHLMCDTESAGQTGVEHLEFLASLPVADRQVSIPTITDPRGMDLCAYERLGQPEQFARLERRATVALRSLGVMMTDTCINYQTISAPVFGEHVAFGDTGSVIYANSVCGARSNFEGGPAALAAAYTGRVPRYGCHLDRNRKPTHWIDVAFQPQTLSDWGALGAVVGRRTGSYWSTPWIRGIARTPSSDELKHFGAALASYGSVPLFHMQGVTPEAGEFEKSSHEKRSDAVTVGAEDIRKFYESFKCGDAIDVVVFAAPQQSLFEVQNIVRILDGRKISESTALVVATSPEIKGACDRFGFTAELENCGAAVLSGVCFYQMYARELGISQGWKRLASNSAKLVNIIAGYGYEPVLATTRQCVDAAVAGRL